MRQCLARAMSTASPHNCTSSPLRGDGFAGPGDVAGQLTELKGLLDSGVLTQEEFDAEKQKIPGA